MNPLLLLFLAAGLSASVALWQQQSLSRLRAAVASSSSRLLETRSALESEQASFDAMRARLAQLERDRQTLRQDRLAQAQTPMPPLPTPEQEGWWPENRPYFYLPKRYLSKVRLDDRQVVRKGSPNELDWNVRAPDEYTWVTYQPFGDEGLNPHLAILLGMSDDEIVAVNEHYKSFVRSLREVEASRLQRLDPPVPAGGDSNMLVVARLPVLTAETQPLREHWEQALEQTLGPARAELLHAHAARYFDEHLDQLGAEPRDFLRMGAALFVRFEGKWGQHAGSTSYDVNYNCAAFGQDWQYGHLFGPDAPGERK